jgi:hypothetical protein
MEEKNEYNLNTGVESEFGVSGFTGAFAYFDENGPEVEQTKMQKIIERLKRSKAGYWYYRIKNTIDYAVNYDDRDW